MKRFSLSFLGLSLVLMSCGGNPAKVSSVETARLIVQLINEPQAAARRQALDPQGNFSDTDTGLENFYKPAGKTYQSEAECKRGGVVRFSAKVPEELSFDSTFTFVNCKVERGSKVYNLQGTMTSNEVVTYREAQAGISGTEYVENRVSGQVAVSGAMNETCAVAATLNYTNNQGLDSSGTYCGYDVDEVTGNVNN